MVNFNIYDVTKLPNISRRKGNQTMKFGWLTECNKKNSFLKNSNRKCAREAWSRPLFVCYKWEYFLHHILWIIFQKKYFSCHILSTYQFHCLITFTLVGSVCIAIVCFPGCDIVNFVINLIFLIKSKIKTKT